MDPGVQTRFGFWRRQHSFCIELEAVLGLGDAQGTELSYYFIFKIVHLNYFFWTVTERQYRN